MRRQPFDSDAVITQFAVLDALLAGAYESGALVDEVLGAGDLGIGCAEHLGGEVVILDGDAFDVTTDGPVERMAADRSMPFVTVCRPTTAAASLTVNAADLGALTARIEEQLVSRNLFHAIRIDGTFSAVRTRVVGRQEPPLRPLADVAAEQVETVLHDVTGTLVGFWSPAIYQGITVAGLHLHFISAGRDAGGHVLDATADGAQMRLSAYSRLELRLPTDELFLTTELTHDDDHRIVAVEGS